ncbi:NPHP1 [Mytilus edulis]|uniref:NPHP1 n=1 Tax=Mytilus edulis TaxID=6550 RepID=A0A8S3UF30_MYTED|nr:NPHP1 [Mytilus edulis]
MTTSRKSTEEPGECSCGWVFLDLYEPTGGLIMNKTFDLYVNGGTPYEKNVEVDPAISRRTTSNAFMSLISGNKQPRLNIKVQVPKRELKEQLDLLPDILIGNASLISMYSYYRQILADTLLKDRVDLESTELIHSPFLATFPATADQMDLMKIFREAWIERTKIIRAPEKRDIEYMKTEFALVYQSSVYPLVHLSALPTWLPGDLLVEMKRQEEIAKFQKMKFDKKGILAMLLSPDVEYQPFDMKEVAFNVIGQFCHNDPMAIAIQS